MFFFFWRGGGGGVVGGPAVLLTIGSLFIDNSNNALMTMCFTCIRQVKHISLSLIMRLMHCYNLV